MNDWSRETEGERPYHIWPNNDARDHDLTQGPLCPCLPRTKDKGRVIVHNSYDGRECGEVFQDALDRLGQALTAHRHRWTPGERDAYEHARHLVSMHWPRTVEST